MNNEELILETLRFLLVNNYDNANLKEERTRIFDKISEALKPKEESNTEQKIKNSLDEGSEKEASRK